VVVQSLQEIASELRKLKELMDAGFIQQEEYLVRKGALEEVR
jgi:hypothetical protein